MDKIKIRKIEVNAEDLFARIEKLLEVYEFTHSTLLGFPIKDLCTLLGIKVMDLMEFRFDNEQLFNDKFKIDSYTSLRTHSQITVIHRLSTWNNKDKK